MITRTISFNSPSISLTYRQLNELNVVLSLQETTDRDKPGEYELIADYGIYCYTIDNDGDILVTDIDYVVKKGVE